MPAEKTSVTAKFCDKKILCIAGFIITMIIVAVIAWVVEEVVPAQRILNATTPVPIEHHYFTLPYHEQKHRQSYENNTFIQMLHHTHNAPNITDCWVCGMMPAHQKK